MADASGNAWMFVSPGMSPMPLPLAWCVPGARQLSLWCCFAEAHDLGPESAQDISKANALMKAGALQPLLKDKTWSQIVYGVMRRRGSSRTETRSDIASDYKLPPRALGGDMASLCTTFYGMSERLEAAHKALFFLLSIEPLMQLCNRLTQRMRVRSQEQTCELSPGSDQALATKAAGRIELYILGSHGPMELETPLRVDELARRKQIVFRSQHRVLEVMVSVEVGLSPPTSGPLQVHRYTGPGVASRRLIIYASHWLMNRCTDCQLFVPAESETRAVGAEHWALRHVKHNALRMLSNHVIRHQSIRIGVCGEICHTRHVRPGQKPVSHKFQVHRAATIGEVRVPEGKPIGARCFSYTVKSAPWPFYRTLVVEVTRRYTILNRKKHTLWCIEKKSGRHLELRPGERRHLDPEQRLIVMTIVGYSGEDRSGCSEFFRLDVDKGKRFQLLHQLDAKFAAAAGELVLPRPLCGPPVAPPADRRSWCITQVDFFLDSESGAIVISFADPLQPAYQIFNRSTYTLTVRQRGSGPTIEVPPDRQIPFAWYSIKSRLDSPWLEIEAANAGEHARKAKYQVKQIQVHEHPLKLGRDGLDTCFVSTRARGGGRQVHIHPWCQLANKQVFDVQVCFSHADAQSSMIVPASGSVCIPPPGKGFWPQLNERFQLHCRRSHAAADAWEAPLILAHSLVGSRGYIRLPGPPDRQQGADAGGHRGAVTEVHVERDAMSDFLIVTFMTCDHTLYRIDNLTNYRLRATVAGDGLGDSPTARLPRRVKTLFRVPGEARSIRLWSEKAESLTLAGAPQSVDFTVTVEDGDVGRDMDVMLEGDFGNLAIAAKKGWPCVIEVKESDTPRRTRRHAQTHFTLYSNSENKAGRGYPRAGLGFTPSLVSWLQGNRQRVHSSPSGRQHVDSSSPTQSPLQRAKHPMQTLVRLSAAAAAPRRLLQRAGLARRILHMPSDDSGRKKSNLSGRGPASPQPHIKFTRSGSDYSLASFVTKDVWWTRQTSTNKGTARRRKSATEAAAPGGLQLGGCVQIEGMGISLLDGAALHAVATLHLEALMAKLGTYQDAQTQELEIGVRDLEIVVTEPKAKSFSESVGELCSPLLRRHSAAQEQVKRWMRNAQGLPDEPFLSMRIQMKAGDGGGHTEVSDVKVRVCPMELQLETSRIFGVAAWAMDLQEVLGLAQKSLAEGTAAPATSSEKLDMDATTGVVGDGLVGDNLTDEDFGYAFIDRTGEGETDHAILGEPRCVRRPDEVDLPAQTPLFIRKMELETFSCYVSLNFFGWKAESEHLHDERLQVLGQRLQFCSPLDLSQCCVVLGKATKGRLFTTRIRSLTFKDEFMPNGVPDLVQAIVENYIVAVRKQVGHVFLHSRVLMNPMRVAAELGRSARLTRVAILSCNPPMIVAANLVLLASVIVAIEGPFETIAKVFCQLSTGTLPVALQREPVHAASAMRQALVYGIPWHCREVSRDWRRLSRQARASKSCVVVIRCLFLAAVRSSMAIVSILLVTVLKLLQVLQLLLQQLAGAVCPAFSTHGPMTSLRVGAGGMSPQLFRKGSAVQFSTAASSPLSAVRTNCPDLALWCVDWRVRELPSPRCICNTRIDMRYCPKCYVGTLVAAQGGGIFLAKPGRTRRGAQQWEVVVEARDVLGPPEWLGRTCEKSGERYAVRLQCRKSRHKQDWALPRWRSILSWPASLASSALSGLPLLTSTSCAPEDDDPALACDAPRQAGQQRSETLDLSLPTKEAAEVAFAFVTDCWMTGVA
eukprot:TRINITY_DN40946_c0_g1_i1.p1 TRINITY_DN40946_c0_g1~~TRINITY_DN40946_c0_g1_i1.p1  ORF type:complete len:1756 (-),score=254.31 TRINITY_DN40946_c0_g1_i1:254-5521(-)